MLVNRDDCIEKITKLCDKYSDILGLVILFGSVARGTHTEKSDIDLYVESKDTKMTTAKMEQSRRFLLFAEELIRMFHFADFDLLVHGGIRDVTSVRKTVLWEQIVKDGVILHDQRTICSTEV